MACGVSTDRDEGGVAAFCGRHVKNKPIRLQKYLAERGIGSRRHCEKHIADGLVQVDGITITEPGTVVVPGISRVSFRGQRVPESAQRVRTIVLNKPRGYECTRSGAARRTVYDLVRDIPEAIVSAGRLDKNSEGLLIMTNDGDLSNELTHPSFEHEKEYRVTVSGDVDASVLARLKESVTIDGRPTSPAAVTFLTRGSKEGRTVLKFILKEGRNRQIRRICDHAGIRIHRLVRTRIGPVSLRGLKVGEWHELNEADVCGLTACRGHGSRKSRRSTKIKGT